MSQVVDLHKSGTSADLGIQIITCSTSRYEELKTGKKTDDVSGDIVERLVLGHGHRVEGRVLLPDSKPKIRRAVRAALASKHVEVILITGGTGVSPHDVTIESVSPLYQKEISGFGELFRKLSYEKIGSAAMLTRASAGLVNGKAIFCLPGSPDAVQTALDSLILPELGHLMKISREH
jgi:molybdenum cofactor biosynthesis protein B